MSDLFVDNIKHQSSQGSGTITLGTSGETIALASGASVTGNGLVGITMVDQWRLNAQLLAATAFITTNLERADDASWSGIGTGMSESSGVFSFPQTGIYEVEFIGSASFYNNSSRYIGCEIHVTTDNSTYTRRALNYDSISQFSSTGYASIITKTLVDVTDTSNVKVKFKQDWQNTNSNAHIQGDTDYNRTTFTFKRLGDT